MIFTDVLEIEANKDNQHSGSSKNDRQKFEKSLYMSVINAADNEESTKNQQSGEDSSQNDRQKYEKSSNVSFINAADDKDLSDSLRQMYKIKDDDCCGEKGQEKSTFDLSRNLFDDSIIPCTRK